MAKTKIQPVNVYLPEQVIVMTEVVKTMARGDFPDPDGKQTAVSNKKDIIGRCLFEGTYRWLRDNGFLDSAIRGFELHSEGEFDHHLYGFNIDHAEVIAPKEQVEPSADLLKDLKVTPE